MAEPYAGLARLRASGDIQAVLRRGRTCGGAYVVVKALARPDEEPARVAVIAGRKVGGAVDRNRVKRRLRAAAAAVPLAPGRDIVLIGRTDTLAAPFPALVAELDGCEGGTRGSRR